ncbi:hypothetical protein QYE76_041602 [Lolium multiflorum]|uniref:Transposon protein, putative, CACTA, En/Spm sub-class n=1 Tax=Lolium multiflorum TaxID=4521 RepID=A0AAD8TDP9_LOLMU|nr:hypothetical protein QYE76_041602 [Lolium multiflorum]
MAQGQAVDPALLDAIVPLQSQHRKSSVASTQQDNDDDDQVVEPPRYPPVDDLTESRPCELHVKVFNLSFKAAVGILLPTRTYHCRPVQDDFAVVMVDEVMRDYEQLVLEHPAGEDGEIKELGEARRTTVQWRKENIVFPGEKPPSRPPRPPPPPPAQSPPRDDSPLRDDDSPVHEQSPQASPSPLRDNTPPPPPPRQETPPPPPKQKRKLTAAPPTAPKRSSTPMRAQTPELLPHEQTDEQKAFLAPKKMFIPPHTMKHFAETRIKRAEPRSDYDRSVGQSSRESKAKKVAHLEHQDNQSIPHFGVQSYDDPEMASMIEREARGKAWKRFITTVPGKWKSELTFKDYPMSHPWMYGNRCAPAFREGVNSFLLVAEANKSKQGFMCCPCLKCKNEKDYSCSRDIKSHLLRFGFMSSYNVWTKHGEEGVMMEDGDEEEDNDDQYRSMFSECNDTAMDDNEEEGGEEQASDDPVDDDLRRAISDARRDCGTDKERLQFDKMLEDHHKLLYPGCEDGHRKLGSILELLKWKAEVGVTDSGFEKLMIILKKLFPRNNELPVSTYEAKKLVCPLGLDVQKIHACINDCILYRGEKYENLNKCPICGALRYKIRKDDPGDVEGEPPRKRVPAKVMWYAPIIPRLKRLFRNKEHAQLLRWHMEERKKDAMLRHPADGRQWRNIGREFPDFAGLQEDVVECLVSFELLFPPSFFNIMTHLLVHLVEEIRILGPVFLHNMFPFERFMGVLKKYVHNRARPEGSISKGYGTEEVIEFCVDFLPDLKPIGVPESRYEGRLTGKGTLGRKSMVCRDKISFNQAHYTVLYNSILVAPYIEKHKNALREINPGQPESLITRQHINTFGSWLQRHLINDPSVVDQLFLLARLPSSNICTFQGYEINGNTFYTIDQDKKSTNQNSGVRFDATDENGQTTTYYGYIEEIWELDYGPTFKVPLFRCKWVKLSGIHIDDKYGMITVDPNNLAYLDEPFVLASEVAQARHRFYFVLFLRQGAVRYMLYLIEQCVHRRILILPTALVPVAATNRDKRYEEDGPPSSNFNEAGRRMWWRGRTLQSVMAYRGPRLRYPQSQPTRGHPPRFDNRDPDGSDDDVGDYDDYSGEYYRTRHDYD